MLPVDRYASKYSEERDLGTSRQALLITIDGMDKGEKIPPADPHVSSSTTIAEDYVGSAVDSASVDNAAESEPFLSVMEVVSSSSVTSDGVTDVLICQRSTQLGSSAIYQTQVDVTGV